MIQEDSTRATVAQTTLKEKSCYVSEMMTQAEAKVATNNPIQAEPPLVPSTRLRQNSLYLYVYLYPYPYLCLYSIYQHRD